MPARPLLPVLVRRNAAMLLALMLGVAMLQTGWSGSAVAQEGEEPPDTTWVGGAVTGPDGPVEGAEVILWERNEETGSWAPRFEALTYEEGWWTEVVTAGTYRVEVRADGLFPEFQPNASDVHLAEDVVLDRGGSYRVDASLRRGSHELGGRLTVLADEPVRGAHVRVFRLEDGALEEVAVVPTDVDGSWSARVDPGAYRVRFGPDGASSDETWLGPDDDPTTVEVGTEDVVGLDEQLDGRVLQGRVTAPDGPPVRSRVFLEAAPSGLPACSVVRETVTDADGYYSFVGLRPDTYFPTADPTYSGTGTGYEKTMLGGAPYAECGNGYDSAGVQVGGEPVVADLVLRSAGSPWPSPSPSPVEPSPVEPSPVEPSPSDPTVPPAPRVPRPFVLGSARVGGLFVGLAWPRPGARVSTSWLRDGVPISGATGPLYLVRRADRGSTLAMRATYLLDGGGTVTSTSPGWSIR